VVASTNSCGWAAMVARKPAITVITWSSGVMSMPILIDT
jgi:hypothetical protein